MGERREYREESSRLLHAEANRQRFGDKLVDCVAFVVVRGRCRKRCRKRFESFLQAVDRCRSER
jgi:hypothetical protein